MHPLLYLAAIAYLCAAGLCAIVIAFDILAGHQQKMWIMDLVWPITALYAGPLALWFYYSAGRLSTKQAMQQAQQYHEKKPAREKPMWQMVAVAATHCGAGCTLGDIAAEWIVFAVPFTLFGMKTFAGWVVDYILAFSFGIAFQYLTIKPMRDLSPTEGLVAAVKADALSLTSWQIGMFGWMAITVFVIFGHELHRTNPVFWLMMQIAMLVGFITAYPVNWWLLQKGLKEKM